MAQEGVDLRGAVVERPEEQIGIATASDLAIETKENTLTIRGSRESRDESQSAKPEVLYQGIAARSFERRFQLADHVQVTGASLENGLLHVDLLRELPEAQKPRQITIATEGAKPAVAIQKAA